MSNKKCVIEKGSSFNTIKDKAETPDDSRSTDVIGQKTALTYYANNLPSAIHLSEHIPIFLDTNVLLRGYSISPAPRAFLYEFFTERKNQIVVTKQIEQEFIKNRKKVIKLYENLPDVHLTDASDTLSTLLFELNTVAPESENSNYVDDELLDLFASFEQIDNLSTTEKDFLKKEFDVLSNRFKSHQRNGKTETTNRSFPGMGDILEKPRFPYGDYFIYHEMLKYSYEKNQDVIFLTFDVAKEDWLKSNKEPHAHYIHRTFALNEKMIFILNANTFFEDLYTTSFDALVPIPKKVDHFIIESKFEKELAAAFLRLEQRIKKLAQQLNIDTSNEISTKDILDELNYNDHISDDTYFELMGIWSIRDALIEGDIEKIKRTYTPNELAETSGVVEDNISVMDKLLISSKK